MLTLIGLVVIGLLLALLFQGAKIMAKIEDFTAVLARIDAATTAIGVKIQKLLDQLAAGGLTEAQEADVLAQASAEAAKLEGIAADPANPVPTT